MIATKATAEVAPAASALCGATLSEFRAARDYHSGTAVKRTRSQDYAAWKRTVAEG